MTAAEQSVEMELSSGLLNESKDSTCITPENISDSNRDFKKLAVHIHEMESLTNPADSEDSELPGNNVTEKSRKPQRGPSVDAKYEYTLPITNDDKWLDIMGSGDFKKKVIKAGLGEHTRPNRGDRVTMNVSYYVNGSLFNCEKNVKFIVGDKDVIQGLDLVACLMENNEYAQIVIPSKLAYGSIGLPPKVPPDSQIVVEMWLTDVEPLDQDALSVSERIELGNEKRSRGNFYYERREYIDAIHVYERAAEYLEGVKDCSDSSPEELQEIVDLRLKVYNNMAATHLKLSAYKAALKSVDSVLKIQPKNVKALYRKGRILGSQGATDEAIACMKMAANLEPETKIIQTELTRLRNLKKKEEQNQKAMYQRMFKSEPKKTPNSVSAFRKWCMISCGVAVAVCSALAYRQLHT